MWVETVPSFVSTTLADWSSSSPNPKYRAIRCSRLLHLLCASVRLELHFTAITKQILQAPNNSSLQSCLSKSVSSSGICLTDPATLGVGARLCFVSTVRCNTALVYFSVGTFSCLSLYNIRSRYRDVHTCCALLVRCPDSETDSL